MAIHPITVKLLRPDPQRSASECRYRKSQRVHRVYSLDGKKDLQEQCSGKWLYSNLISFISQGAVIHLETQPSSHVEEVKCSCLWRCVVRCWHRGSAWTCTWTQPMNLLWHHTDWLPHSRLRNAAKASLSSRSQAVVLFQSTSGVVFQSKTKGLITTNYFYVTLCSARTFTFPFLFLTFTLCLHVPIPVSWACGAPLPLKHAHHRLQLSTQEGFIAPLYLSHCMCSPCS